MKRYLQYDPININEFELEKWNHPVHKHNHCEIIFIRSGEGRHSINGNLFSYKQGDIFLLGPEDFHFFEIETPTKFCYVRFTESLFEKSTNKSDSWQRSFEMLLHAPYQYSGSVVKKEQEKKLLNNLLEVLLHEYYNPHAASYTIMIGSVMKSILKIVERNITAEVPAGELVRTASVIENIISYIRKNIFKPEKLRIEILAANFNYSPKYVSIYFKRQTGENLQKYILKYKLKMIEYRLLYSDSSVSEITRQFEFTDESHFYRIFRKYYGENPTNFRIKNKRESAAV